MYKTLIVIDYCEREARRDLRCRRLRGALKTLRSLLIGHGGRGVFEKALTLETRTKT